MCSWWLWKNSKEHPNNFFFIAKIFVCLFSRKLQKFSCRTISLAYHESEFAYNDTLHVFWILLSSEVIFYGVTMTFLKCSYIRFAYSVFLFLQTNVRFNEFGCLSESVKKIRLVCLCLCINKSSSTTDSTDHF